MAERPAFCLDVSSSPFRQSLAHLSHARSVDFCQSSAHIRSVTPEDPHILVVDDHREIRESLAQFLKKNGRRATAVDSAEAARKAIKENRIDLVIKVGGGLLEHVDRLQRVIDAVSNAGRTVRVVRRQSPRESSSLA